MFGRYSGTSERRAVESNMVVLCALGFNKEVLVFLSVHFLHPMIYWSLRSRGMFSWPGAQLKRSILSISLKYFSSAFERMGSIFIDSRDLFSS